MAAERDTAMTDRPIEEYRQDFPVLKTTMNGKPLAFLDSAASAQKPQAVIDKMRGVMEGGYSNIHRGLYEISQNLTEEYEAVREKVRALLNAPSDKEIVFTRNTTEAINLVVQSWARTFLKKGDEVILSEMEHHANIVPWQILRDQIGIVIKIIPVLDDGTLDLQAYERLLSHKTKFVSVVHISNALGTINPVRRITEIAKDFTPDIKVLIDGSQGVVHGAVDVQDIGCDFYAFTGHKLYGSTGAGVLWGRYDLLEAMPPYQGGGDMIETVRFERTRYKEPPFRFEAGTPAILEVLGLGAAVDYFGAIPVDKLVDYESGLRDYAIKALEGIPGLRLYGTAPEKAAILSFTMEQAHHSDIAMVLDQMGVAVRAGHHCCMPLMQRYGVDGTVRASIGLYTNKDDIDQFLEGLEKVKSLFS